MKNNPLREELDKKKDRINLFFNTKFIGFCYKEIDGFYVFKMGHGGCWNEYSLSLILDKLQKLNEPFNKEVEEYFKKEIKC
jgi:hypothetical protein